MRILALCKRQYTRHDLLDDRYGRLRELPLALTRLGHEVRGLCLSYRRQTEGVTLDRDPDHPGAQVQWHSFNAGPFFLPGLARFIRSASAHAREFQPDIVWSASDSFYGVIGARVARAAGALHVFDLYDNFESFAAARLPVVRGAYRSTARQADGVVCVSEALRAKVVADCHRTGPLLVLPNGVDTARFRPRDRDACRRRFSLPTEATLVGITGAISRSRDIDTVLQALSSLMEERQEVHLVLAGPRDRGLSLPHGPRIHDLAVRPHDEVPDLIGALDIAIVGNLDSEFGRYCFPQKAFETVASNVAMVASDVGAMHELLEPCPQARFRPRDVDDLLRALRAQLDNSCRLPPGTAPDWDELGARLESFLRELPRSTV
jgi:teichuronic acid biosynthesis glycosyltransferase TuaC